VKQKKPILAGLLSLLVPGLGQGYLGERRRGGSVLVTSVAVGGLLLWREAVLLYSVFALFWLWNAWDAYSSARGKKVSLGVPLVLAGFLVYAVAWQTTEIAPLKLVAGVGDIRPLVTDVLWPIPAAFERPRVVQSAKDVIEVPCSATPPTPEPQAEGKPQIHLSANCAAIGERIVLTGSGFRPNWPGAVWWENTIGQQFRVRQQGEYLRFETDQNGSFQVEVQIPLAVPEDMRNKPQIHHVEARVSWAEGAWQPTQTLKLTIAKMLETIFLALMATTFGIIAAVPLSFLAARNLMSFSPLSLSAYYATRTVLNITRSIEPLIWAIIFVVWVGLGPFAGTMALAVHSIAALGKVFSESIESIDPGPIEAVTATGASRLQTIIYAVVPQVVPPYIAWSIYRWDINVRMSTIIGFVGGGGIGFLLQQWIRLLRYQDAGVAVWAIAIVVGVLDYTSAVIRERVV
jgi:phosphonate transport system permease protein